MEVSGQPYSPTPDRSLYPIKKKKIGFEYAAGWAPEPVWAVLEKTKFLAPARFEARNAQPISSPYTKLP